MQAASLAVAAALLFTGCAGIPAKGPASLESVRRALELLAVDEPPTADAREPERRPRPLYRGLKPRPRPGSFEMDISSQRDFVSQATSQWCVAAAMQTMVNIIDRRPPDRSVRTQERLYQLGRRHSNERKLGSFGIEPEGWAEGLNVLGYGPYRVHVAPSRRAAVRQAALSMRLTGKPVGLVTWRGAHSWVMHGFRASGDPGWTRRFEVTHVRVHDVWYPRISSIWGPSRSPASTWRVADLAQDYLPWRRPGRRYPLRDGRFLLILPLTVGDGTSGPRADSP